MVDEPQVDIVQATVKGNRAAVRAAIRSGADPSQKVDKCIPLFFLAAARGHLGVLRDLIESGADLNAKDYRDDSILKYLATQPSVPRLGTIMRYLIEAGADPDLAGACMWPLDTAILYRNDTAATELVSAGARIRDPMRDHPEYLKHCNAAGHSR